jgi:N-acetylglucosamine kinase-like BadF-type ATPase
VSGPSDVEPAVLAFDGGSTKTDVVLVSRQGAVLGRARVGPSNHQLVGLDGTIAALTEAVTAVLNAAQRPTSLLPLCPTGVYCLAGIDLPVDEEKLAPAIDALGWTERVILRNDTFAVSRAGTTSRWGIGVVCGTGMNCAAVGPDGRSVRFPALAELSGDFAPGGAWLGVRALGLALRAGDGRGPATTLRERVPAQLGTPDAEAALTGIYSGTLPYDRLFELARVLLDAAADGDAPARVAANTLADEIAAFVRAAVVRLDLQDEAVEVVLGGGVFDTNDAAFHARVADGVRAAARRATLVRLDAPPVLGAALIGLDAEDTPPAAAAALRQALRLHEDSPAGAS